MTAMGMIALGNTWGIIGRDQDLSHMLVLEVWVREILG